MSTNDRYSYSIKQFINTLIKIQWNWRSCICPSYRTAVDQRLSYVWPLMAAPAAGLPNAFVYKGAGEEVVRLGDPLALRNFARQIAHDVLSTVQKTLKPKK